MHCAPHTTTLCGEYYKNYFAEFIDPHMCGYNNVYLAQYMSHVLRKWDSQFWSYVVCSSGKGVGLILVCLGLL